MSDIETLLSEIRGYCERAGVEPSVLGRRAVQDSKFVARLEAGGQCLPSTMAKIRTYMAAHPPKEAPEAEGNPPPAQEKVA